jgi:hypothetical protein
MAHRILTRQSAWQQFGTVLTHRAWPLATVPQATPVAFSLYPHGKTRRIAANIAKFAQAAVISYRPRCTGAPIPTETLRAGNNTKHPMKGLAMSALGQELTLKRVHLMSALLPISDIRTASSRSRSGYSTVPVAARFVRECAEWSVHS